MQLGVENLLGISEVYVVFENVNTIWWLKFLKKGFRHCFIVLLVHEHNLAILLNPRSNQVDIQLFHNCNTQIALDVYSAQAGYTLERVHIKQAPLKVAPVMVFTCVEFEKIILGIHDISIITPYQLYKNLKSSRKKVLTF